MSNELYLNDTNLKDPVQDLNDPLADPTQVQEQTPPGFFSTLRNPMELIFEESLDKDLKIMIEKDIHRNRCKAKKIGSLILKPAL